MARNRTNRLIREKSHYLLQHAENPVDWYAWSDEAFDVARKEDKPVFLSIGYSTCHWCHVMAHESFEDPEVARLMNKAFVNIKVDREERPDVDDVYMTVCQMMTGSGGWPLTIIMTPDKQPFFAATYIPKENRYGRLGMKELIPRIQKIWEEERYKINDSAKEIVEALKQTGERVSGEPLTQRTLDRAYELLESGFDPRFGGFSQAPKFPTPHNLIFLLRYWKRTGNEKALQMAERTLIQMRMGGIFDQVGFGFHRYSTDGEWLVPHFEKMVYDQALLALAYTEAFQATGNKLFGRTAQEIFTYVLRDMTAPEGGFYSAEDADSEGEEGKFYIWEEAEIREILAPDEADLMIKLYNVKAEGNFSEEASGRKTGKNILHLTKPLAEAARNLNMDAAELTSRMESAREQLFQARKERVHPLKDDKILTDWNGLMIAALSLAARVLERPDYLDAARKAIHFIRENLTTADGRLLHRYRDGEAAIPAFLDDYAFFTWGLLEFYESAFEVEFLKYAIDLTDIMFEHFRDADNGGFFQTAEDAESLLIRKKEIYDGAIPSGNSLIAHNLLKLGRMTGNPLYGERADEILKVFAGTVQQMPVAYTMLLSALNFALGAAYEVVISGDPGNQSTRKILQTLRQKYIPNKVVLLQDGGDIVKLAPFTENMQPIDGQTAVFVCRNFACELPTTDENRMLVLLGEEKED